MMDLKIGEEVDLVIGRFTKIGITVLVNASYEGMLYKNEVYQKVREGQKVRGYVKKIREDEKIDVCLQPIGFLNKTDENQKTVLEKLLASKDGFLALNDKSGPEEIKYQLKMSKKSFKSAIGALYKSKKIVIASKGIYLVKKANS